MKITDLHYEIPKKKINTKLGTVIVKEYLPSEQKSKLIEELGKFCFSRRLLDRAEIDAVLNALIVLYYSSIQYEYETVRDLVQLFDYLEINQVIETVITSLPEVEYNSLISYYMSTIKDVEIDKQR